MLSFGDSRYGKGAAGDQQRCDGKRASCVARCGDDVFGVGCIAVIFCILVTVVVAGIVLVGLVIVFVARFFVISAGLLVVLAGIVAAWLISVGFVFLAWLVVGVVLVGIARISFGNLLEPCFVDNIFGCIGDIRMS